MKVFAAILFAATISLAVSEKARFDNYRVYRLNIENELQLSVLQQIEQFPDGYNFWNQPQQVGTQISLQVPPHKFGDFSEFVERYEVKNMLIIKNLQEKMDAVQPAVMPKSAFSWDAYYNLAGIYGWLDTVVAENPSIAQIIIGGSSHEGREIKGVKLSYKAGNPGVFMESCIHAREWISCATNTWILNELITSTDPAVRNIAENYDWYFFPVTNPDGYEFTHTNNRNWRKTRFPFGICIGADPNRNWGFMWNQGGASSNACMDTFAGPNAFSEIETASLSAYFSSLENISTYLSIHSYSQMLLVPYGHTSAHLDNHDVTVSIGTKAIEKLAERFGTRYVVGNIAETIYIATGGSIDWIKDTFKTPLVYAYELRDLGTHGFLLPADQIIPTAQETLDSIIVILNEGAAVGYH